MTSKEIRESFKHFFESKGHKIVPSAPMVVKNDPTLMFTNAGMNQFKDIFLGNKKSKYNRVADSQKCLRVSGKHNDLEEVGHDTYHHTMFEMLGNWSFGDYFKKEAISWAWEYLVDVLKIDQNRLYATVFEGYGPENLKRDDEAEQIWLQFLPKERIINGNKKDNFWEMGETGPCGPCSEIHIDLRSDEDRKKLDGRELVNGDSPEVIEIWNNVFMQFNRMADGHLECLPAKHVDTGLGFERLCMVVQGKKSNYDTDVFKPILDEISNICNIKYGKDRKTDIAMRVIADHLRAVSFSITDGQLPSNAKAGYVIRRILRRAVRYGYTFLDMKYAFIYQLVPALIESMGGAFPELEKDQKLIERVIKQEEESFLRTLANGIKMLDNSIMNLKAQGKDTLNGKDIFTLYDTFGFPLDLTTLILSEQNLKSDIEGFEKEMSAQRKRAKKDASIDTEDWTILSKANSEFVGYDSKECQTQVIKYRKVTQKGKELYQIVLAKTPFYGEMGGQIGDTGYIQDSNSKYSVINTIKENDLTIHLVEKLPNVKEDLTAVVNSEKRNAICANHSATHLLDAALKKVLGSHVEQKGSFVTEKSLRFDFSHFSKVTNEELRKVEQIVNAQVREDIPLNEFRNTPIAEAKEMGAIALFSEKYGENVRVIKFGESIELCGGTHVKSTGKIGSIRIISESAVAAGIRRIEAITGNKADKLFYDNNDTLDNIKELLNNQQNLTLAISKILEENSELKKQIESINSEKAQVLKASLIKQAQEINGIKVIKFIGEAKSESIKDIAFQLKNEFKEKFAFIAGFVNNGKPGLTIIFSDDLVKEGKHAGKLISKAAKVIKGGGGGQAHFASAGGKDPKKLKEAVDIIIEELK